MLVGTNILPGHVRIGGKEVQLGDIVRRAFKDSGLTQAAWNAEPERANDHRLIDAFYDMRAEAGE